MKNLRKLKGFKEYQGISVTGDYTISEREIIRQQKYEAHIKNLSEPPSHQTPTLCGKFEEHRRAVSL